MNYEIGVQSQCEGDLESPLDKSTQGQFCRPTIDENEIESCYTVETVNRAGSYEVLGNNIFQHYESTIIPVISNSIKRFIMHFHHLFLLTYLLHDPLLSLLHILLNTQTVMWVHSFLRQHISERPVMLEVILSRQLRTGTSLSNHLDAVRFISAFLSKLPLKNHPTIPAVLK